jgi:hypothetical protein
MMISIFILSCIDRTAGFNNPGENSPAIKASTSPGSEPSLTGDNKNTYIPGEVLVRFAKGTGSDIIKNIQEQMHLQTIRSLSVSDLYLMRITDGTSVEQVIIRLKDHKEVLYSEPNYPYKTDTK